MIHIYILLLIAAFLIISAYTSDVVNFISGYVLPKIFKSWEVVEYDSFETVYYSTDSNILVVVNTVMRFITVYYVEDYFDKRKTLSTYGITVNAGKNEDQLYESKKILFLLTHVIMVLRKPEVFRLKAYNDKINSVLSILD